MIRTAGPSAATPFGEGVVGRADFLVSCETLLAQGNPGDLQGRLDLLGLEVAEEDAVAHIGPARKVRPPDGESRREFDLGGRPLLLRERGQESLRGVHDVGRLRRGEQVGAGEAAGVVCAAARGAAEPRLAARRPSGRAPAREGERAEERLVGSIGSASCSCDFHLGSASRSLEDSGPSSDCGTARRP